MPITFDKAFDFGAFEGAETGTGLASGAALAPLAKIGPSASAALASGLALGGSAAPTWVSPADGVPMSNNPVLVFLMPMANAPQHFWLELDTADTFDTGNLRIRRSDLSQTSWEYWDGGAWVVVPAGGVPVAYVGNEARFTVETPLAVGTWYRRVRAGVGELAAFDTGAFDTLAFEAA